MPILDQASGDFSARYVFCGRDILLVDGKLPDQNFYEAFVSAQKEANNLECEIAEIPQNYRAAKIARLSDQRELSKIACDKNLFDRDENRFQGQNAAAPLGEKKVFGGALFVALREFCWSNPKLAPAALRAKGILFWRDTYRHCPKCGAAFENDKNETALFCPKCDFKLYPRIEPCVIVLVSRGDEILLVKDKRPGRDFYSCVAGFIELGESAVEAAKREVKEETGLEVKNIKLLGSQSWPYPDQLMLAFSAEWQSGEIVLQEEELLDARWFRRDSLPSALAMRGSVAWNLIHGKF